MPQYEATDPKTGRKWTWDGQKWNPAVTGPVQRFKESFRSGMGFEPNAGVKEDLGQIWSGLKEIGAHPIDTQGHTNPVISGAQKGYVRRSEIDGEVSGICGALDGWRSRWCI